MDGVEEGRGSSAEPDEDVTAFKLHCLWIVLGISLLGGFLPMRLGNWANRDRVLALGTFLPPGAIDPRAVTLF